MQINTTPARLLVLLVMISPLPAYADSNWNSMVWGMDVWAVPEPGFSVVLAAGICLLSLIARR